MVDICYEKKDLSCKCSECRCFQSSMLAKVQRVNREGVVFSGSKTAAGWKELAQLATQPTARFVSR
jgi:hypothetical protein